MSSSNASWDPEAFLWDRVSDLLRRHFGVAPSRQEYERCVKDIKGEGGEIEVTFDGLTRGTRLIADMNALAYWVTKRLCATPDGIESVLDVAPDPASTGSALYNACLETMRTSRGTFFSAEQVAERVHYTLEPRKRRLRQLRRLLVRVCKDNGGRVRRKSKAEVLYGFR